MHNMEEPHMLANGHDDMHENGMEGHQQILEVSDEDIPIACRDCGCTFLFSVGEQEFYVQKGFDIRPTRCKPCRTQKKFNRTGGAPMGYGAYPAYDGYGYMPKPRNVCHAFQRGECMYGTECRFAHDDGSGVMYGNEYGYYPMGYGYAPKGPRSSLRKPCFAFQRGQCTYGTECRYSHDEAVNRASPAGAPRSESGPRGFCHAFQKGFCKYGDTCRFIHE